LLLIVSGAAIDRARISKPAAVGQCWTDRQTNTVPYAGSANKSVVLHLRETPDTIDKSKRT